MPTGTTTVLAQARDALEISPDGCAPHGCGWYHGIWPSLRYLGLVASPDRNRPLFQRALSPLARADRPVDVLVSGAADGGMFEVVWSSLSRDVAAGAEVRATVLDRCATPVTVAARHAAREGVDVTPWVSDVFETDRPAAFDAICTHGLFPLVPVARRRDLIGRWAALLRPSGVLATTTSLAGPDAPPVSRFSDDAAALFADTAVERAATTGYELLGADELWTAAHHWARSATVNVVRDVGDVRRAFAGVAFEPVDVQERVVDGSLDRSASGPWTARSTRYAEIVAVRSQDDGAARP